MEVERRAGQVILPILAGQGGGGLCLTYGTPAILISPKICATQPRKCSFNQLRAIRIADGAAITTKPRVYVLSTVFIS